MTEICLAKTIASYNTIAQLADTIWREHYTPIIGVLQVDYMLDKFQSAKAIKQQVSEGYQYYTVTYNKNVVGYIAFKKEGKTFFLSKIYILKNYRGYGIGKATMAFIEESAIKNSCTSIYLTVNKYNTNSIRAYEKIGFINTKAIVQDIGNGYVMDDYVMEKSIA